MDEEMCAALDMLYSMPFSDPNLKERFSYLKGQIDFIRSVYELEAVIRTIDNMELLDDFRNKNASKVRSLYMRIISIFRGK